MKVAFHTLGCKVNQYETSAMAEAFAGAGYEIVDEHEYADVYVVNTCSVTSVADRKSRQYIRRMKKLNPESVMAVTGCYAQIDPEAVSGLAEVDIVAGTNEKSGLVRFVDEYIAERKKQMHVIPVSEIRGYDDMGTVTNAENRTRAYIKIQEGCDRFCSYCVIPYARGRIRSRSVEEIKKEAQHLIANGYKELVLTGINTALYDMEDVQGRRTDAYAAKEDAYGVEKAVAAVNGLSGDFRIRLSSLEPAVVDAEYVKRLFKYDRLCHHLHLSAQSGSDKVLYAMNRPYDREQYMDIVDALREADPLYGISTDIIVGFPGESEDDFRDSLKLVRDMLFCKTHIFKYSKRPFTKAAEMDGHTAPQVKNRRSEELHLAGEASAEGFFRMNEGTVHRVLTEERDTAAGLICGYTGNYIKTYIEDADIPLNSFVEVRLKEHFLDGMKGECI